MPYKKPSADSEWMPASQAADELGVWPHTVLAWVRDGRLPIRALRFGKTTRLHRGDFRREMDKRVNAGLTA